MRESGGCTCGWLGAEIAGGYHCDPGSDMGVAGIDGSAARIAGKQAQTAWQSPGAAGSPVSPTGKSPKLPK